MYAMMHVGHVIVIVVVVDQAFQGNNGEGDVGINMSVSVRFPLSVDAESRPLIISLILYPPHDCR